MINSDKMFENMISTINTQTKNKQAILAKRALENYSTFAREKQIQIRNKIINRFGYDRMMIGFISTVFSMFFVLLQGASPNEASVEFQKRLSGAFLGGHLGEFFVRFISGDIDDVATPLE